METMQNKLPAVRNRRTPAFTENRDERTKMALVRLSALAPRIRDIMRIGRAIHLAKLPLGKHRPLVTGNVTRSVGYITDESGKPVRVGLTGGTRYDKGIALDENGNPDDRGNPKAFVSPEDPEFLRIAGELLEGFDEFDKAVSAYIDAIGN